jgi:hypothetical protein
MKTDTYLLYDTGTMQAINRVIQDMEQSPWPSLRTSGTMISKEGITVSQGSFIHHPQPGRETHHSVDRKAVIPQVRVAQAGDTHLIQDAKYMIIPML